MDLKIPKVRDAAKVSKMPLNDGTWIFFFPAVLIYPDNTYISQVTLCCSPSVSLRLYLERPPLKMSHWQTHVPYFRIKDVNGESDLSTLLLLPLRTHETSTHSH